MPVIKYRKVVEKLLKNPAFSYKELLAYGVPRTYAKRLVHYLSRKGKMSIVEKGVYTTVDDPIIVASFISFPSYVSMFSALFVRGVLSQIPMNVQVVTTKRRKKKTVVFKDTNIEFFRIKRDYFFGFTQTWYDGYQIPVARIEKAIIDCFYFNVTTPEFLRDSLEDFNEKIDLTLLNEYLDIIKKRSIKQKVMELIKDSYDK
ncbi:MAG: type IV toxin-antitoxin system AbiEi family antitoxin domain-containing protein [Candidatus Asgardarchaeia archaeon]